MAAAPLPYPPIQPATDDPAWQPPRDPLREARAGIIAREIPVITTQTHWAWNEVRAALDDLRVGIFDRPAQLAEAILWDGRVQAAMGSRTGGLLGRPVKIEPADNARVRGSRAAQEVADAWQDVWPVIARESAMAQLHRWGVMLFGLAQLTWDTSVTPWVPHLVKAQEAPQPALVGSDGPSGVVTRCQGFPVDRNQGSGLCLH